MTAPRTKHTVFLLALAGLLVTAGFLLALFTLADARSTQARIRQLRRTREELSAARKELQATESILAAFSPERIQPESLASLHHRFFPNLSANLSEHSPALATPVGTLRRITWLNPDAPAELVLVFAAACESARPPWRVESFRFSALPGAPGRIRAELVLVGLEP